MSEKTPSGRGEATRERLVAAALDLFGRRGYEGVGAREIAQAAGAPLSAIPYHFKSKEALYRAAMERVRLRLSEALAPAVATASAALQGTPASAGAALIDFQAALLDAIAAAPEAEAWAKLLLREHMDPGPAFDLVYEDAGRGAVEMMAALIARASGRDVEEEAVAIEAFVCMGEALIFRTVQAAVLRRLGWRAIGDDEVGRIRDVLAKRTR